MSSLLNYPDCIRESLAVFQLLRGLGFASEEIFFDVDTKKKPGYLRTGMRVIANSKEFSVSTGWFKGNAKKLIKLWGEATDRWNTTTDEDRSGIIEFSNTFTDYANTSEFLRKLKELGFMPSTAPCNDSTRKSS